MHAYYIYIYIFDTTRSVVSQAAVVVFLKGPSMESSLVRVDQALTVFLPTDTAFTKMGLGVASSLHLGVLPHLFGNPLMGTIGIHRRYNGPHLMPFESISTSAL